jgi:hypothetical protein
MVLNTIFFLALPSLAFHAFAPLVPPRPVVRYPVGLPEMGLPDAAAEQSTQRPAAFGPAHLPPRPLPVEYLQAFRPPPAFPQASRVSQDITLRMPVAQAAQAAPSLFSPATNAYRLTLIGTGVVLAFLVRRILARTTAATRLQIWWSYVREKAKSLVYTTIAIACTVVMLLGSPAGALSTSEAPMQTATTSSLQIAARNNIRKMPSALSNFVRRPAAAPQQKMIKYSAKNYIFSDDLTRMSRLEREFDDILWHSLANKTANRVKLVANLGEAALLVGAVRGGLVAYERWQKEEERKDIQEELERTGMYVSVDASSVVEFTDAKTGKKSKAGSSKKQPVIPGSIVIHYELPSGNGKLEKDIRNKVEGEDFALTMLDQLQYKFQELGEIDREDMQAFSGSLLFPKIPAIQAPKLEAGVLEGRVFLSDLGPDATEAVVQAFANSGTRSMIQNVFRGPLAMALGVEEEQVMIANLVRNRDPLFGDGGKLADGPVRQLLSKRASGLLRWIESTSAAEDQDFWESAVTQTIYRDTGTKSSKTDDNADGDKPGSADGPNDSPDLGGVGA